MEPMTLQIAVTNIVQVVRAYRGTAEDHELLEQSLDLMIETLKKAEPTVELHYEPKNRKERRQFAARARQKKR